VVQGEAVEAGGAAQDVDVEEGAEVADVAVVVDGGAAAVEAQRVAVGGEERFVFPERVLKSSRATLGWVPLGVTIVAPQATFCCCLFLLDFS
jgi:hypothetical protein